MMKSTILLLGLLTSVLSGCSSLAPRALQAATIVERLPFPGMSPEQVGVYTACRLALGGNDRRRKSKGQEVVDAASQKCVNDFWKLDDWWPVYVKLWSVSGDN